VDSAQSRSITPSDPMVPIASPDVDRADGTLDTESDPTTEHDAPHQRSFLARHGVTPLEGSVAALAFVWCIAFGPTMSYPSWTPRFALLLLAAPAGLVLLGRQVASRDRAAVVAGALSLWIVVSALASGAARSALIGFVGRDLSALTVVASIGLWSLGRHVGPVGRRWVVGAVLAGSALSAVVGILQLVFDVRTGTLAMNGGRPSGLTPNPVYFGGLMVGAVALTTMWGATSDGVAAPQRTARAIAACAGLTGLFSLAVSISGSRVATAALVIVLVAAAMTRRRTVLPHLAAAVVGTLVGWLLQSAAGRGSDALTRVAESGGGLDGRRQVWSYALTAIADRPVFGWGFGRFQASVRGEYSPEFVAEYAQRDLGVAWFDAHNVVIGVVDAIGVVGLLLMLTWVVAAGRRGIVGIAAFSAAIATTWMLQPPSLATLPLALLIFGVATPVRQLDAHSVRPAGSDPSPEGAPVLVRLAALVGILLAGYVVAADLLLYRATESFDAQASERAARLYPGDPVVAGLVAQVWAIDAGQVDAPEAIEWQRRAVDRDPERPYWRAELAGRYLAAGDLAPAQEQIDAALRLQPTHVASLQLQLVVALRQEDTALLGSTQARLCDVGAPECELDLSELVEEWSRSTG
jgi:O-antigen ligase